MKRIGWTRASGARAFTAIVLFAIGLPVVAERPMTVDNASTPEPGTAELEFGWSRDDKVKGFDGAIGFGPVQNVKLELEFGHVQDRSVNPDLHERGVGVSLKWVPLQAETGLSAGLKLEHGRLRSDFGGEGRETIRASAATGLASWSFASGQKLHFNLGREWARVEHDTEAENTWGTGFEQPLGGGLTITAEIFGAEHSRPDKQLGLRYEIDDGVSLSGAVGRGNDRGFANAGIAWEF